MEVLHIATLPSANVSLDMLDRLRDEFYPIVQRRGYHVLSLSEMCCCGDGMDQKGFSWTKTAIGRGGEDNTATNHNNNNLMGYNEGSHGGGDRIHIRLRDPENHNGVFLPWKGVCETMAHELAHCVHKNHSPEFYELMDDILDEHAEVVLNGGGGAWSSSQKGEAHRLGGGRDSRRTTLLSQLAIERERRQAAKTWSKPRRLGGKGGSSSSASSSARRNLPPGQAAALAAEARIRRIRDDQWCHPCNGSDNEKDVDSSNISEPCRPNDEQFTDTKEQRTDGPTGNEGHTTADASNTASGASKTDVNKEESLLLSQEIVAKTSACTVVDESWTCSQCTSINPPRYKGCRVCGACSVCTFCNTLSSKRCECCQTSLDTVHDQKVAADLMRKEGIELAKQREVQTSINEFGFNIYGTKNKP